MNLRESTLQRVVQLMKDPQHGLVIKDRTFHFHVFPDCFVGNEFVTWTLHNSIIDTREHATMLGQDLLDRGIIYHASNDQPFKDGYFFYTFQKFPEISDSELDIMVIRMKAHPTGVSIQDRSHHLRNYRDCFVGKEAVDWLVNNVPQYAPSRSIAVKLGQELMNKGIVHSANQQHFSDSQDFYYFQKPVYAGYLGKLTKTGTEWKTRWFSIKDVREKKLWYFNSPRDPVPRDFIPLVDAYVRVVLDQEVAFMELCTPLRIFTLRPTSSVLLARWVRVLSDFIGTDGCDNNLRMELAERSISLHESRVSSKVMRKNRLVALGPSLTEVVAGSGLQEGAETPPDPSLLLPSHLPPQLATPVSLPPPLDPILSTTPPHLSTSTSPPLPLPLSSLPSSPPEHIETLDLMYDDLDLDEDEIFPISENGKPPSDDALETKFEEGLVGEANFVVQIGEGEGERGGEKRGEGRGGGMSTEQIEDLMRINELLLSTSLQDNEPRPSFPSLSLLPSMYSDEIFVCPPKDRSDGIDHFHLV